VSIHKLFWVIVTAGGWVYLLANGYFNELVPLAYVITSGWVIWACSN
jgi:hypothetical protein